MSESISENFRKFPIGETRLCDKQLLAIDLLISGVKISEIAQQLQVDPRTLYNWRQTDEFREAMEARRVELWSDSADRIRALISPSIEVMANHLEQKYQPTRFKAASTILRLCAFRGVLNPQKKR